MEHVSIKAHVSKGTAVKMAHCTERKAESLAPYLPIKLKGRSLEPFYSSLMSEYRKGSDVAIELINKDQHHHLHQLATKLTRYTSAF